MRNCTEKNVDKTPENISRTMRYLRIEANTSKTVNRSLRVVSITKLSTSIVRDSELIWDFLRLRRIQSKNIKCGGFKLVATPFSSLGHGHV